jgi:hypothetical protein
VKLQRKRGTQSEIGFEKERVELRTRKVRTLYLSGPGMRASKCLNAASRVASTGSQSSALQMRKMCLQSQVGKGGEGKQSGKNGRVNRKAVAPERV